MKEAKRATTIGMAVLFLACYGLISLVEDTLVVVFDIIALW